MTAPTQHHSPEHPSPQHPSPDQIRAAWDALAPDFDRHTTPHTMLFAEHILSGVRIDSGTRMLDVAAGSGALALPAARRGARVVAVDIAPTMVDRLVQHAREEGLTEVDARVMDGEHLELGDDTFDVSASLNGVSLFPDLRRGLTEMVRVTQPGGTVLVAAARLAAAGGVHRLDDGRAAGRRAGLRAAAHRSAAAAVAARRPGPAHGGTAGGGSAGCHGARGDAGHALRLRHGAA